MSRVRAAPNDRRMAISWRLAVASPVRSALTFVQVTSRTSRPSRPTETAISRTSRSDMGSLLVERRGTTSADGSSALISATCSAVLAATARVAAVAAAMLTPSRRRATARNSPDGSGSRRRRAATGIQSWNRLNPGNPMNFSGATPTIVTGTPFTTSVEPIAPGRFAKTCSHVMCPITATAAVDGSSAPTAGSPGPSAGLTPSTEK